MSSKYTDLESFSLGPFVVEPASGRIVHEEEVRQIQPKVMQLLLCLVENHGQIVSREYLLEEVWAGVFVDGGALRRGIYFLRKSLTLEGEGTAIDTLSKRGYRLNLSPGDRPEAKIEPKIRELVSLDSAYRGLQVFDQDHANQFFGRETLIRQTCKAMDRQIADGRAFIMLLGASGSGKSSLARAGVIPALLEQAAEKQETPKVVIFQSAHGAGDALQQLAGQLLEVFDGASASDQAVGRFVEELSEDVDDAITRLVAIEAGEAEKPDSRVIILFDQFEQLLSTVTPRSENRDLILAALYSLARSGVVQVIATMRSEFYPLLMSHEALRFLKGGHGIVDVTQPGAAEIADIVRKPAALAGLEFERRADGQSLDVVLIDEASTHANSLPLLQFALRELELGCSESRVLTFEQYEALGNLEGCLSGHAERVFQSLPTDAQAVLPQMLSLLVTADPRNAGRLLKKSVALETVDQIPHARELVDKFVDARLMVSFLDQYSNVASIEVVHESVLAYWERARDWAHKSYSDIRYRGWLGELSNKWHADAQSPTYLLRDGKMLVDAKELLKREGFFDEAQQTFVRESLRRADRAGLIKKGIAASLVSMLALSLFMWNKAVDNSKRAERAMNRSNSTSEFMQSIFADADPGNSGEGDLSAVELLDRARDRLKARPISEPSSQADILRALGESYLKMGEYPKAFELFGEAEPLVENFKQESPSLASQIEIEMAGIRRAQRHYEEAESYALKALESASRAGDVFLMAQSQNMLGLIENSRRKTTEAAEYFAAAVLTLESTPTETDKSFRLLSRVQNNLGLTYMRSGEFLKSEVAFTNSLEMLENRDLGESADYTLTLGNLASLRRAEQRNEEAVVLYEQAIEMRTKLHSVSHPEVIGFLTNLASAQINLGRYEDVLKTINTALEADRSHNTYAATIFPLLYARRIAAQQLSGITSPERHIQDAVEGMPTLISAYKAQHPAVVESEMAIAVAQWQLVSPIGSSEPGLCQRTRQLLDAQEERQITAPRVVEFYNRLKDLMITC
ncbi:MAG: tetratricopeptide repeat protein [Gammaproteobacteria bacterium]